MIFRPSHVRAGWLFVLATPSCSGPPGDDETASPGVGGDAMEALGPSSGNGGDLVDNAGGSSSESTGGAYSMDGTGGNLQGTGGTHAVVLSDYVSRKWARWPVPNPPSLGLPHPMSYSETSEGILDEVTGLIWQSTTNSSTTTWEDALAYCEDLGEGWSLPTRIELSSILNNAVAGPKVDSAHFEFGAGAGWTWTSTPWVVNERRGLTGDAALSWFINFAVGDSHNSLSQTAASAYSRCVRVPGTQDLPEQHYVVSENRVIDEYTGLIWQRQHSGDTPSLNYEEAFAYCAGLNLDGYGWRLPSLNEIASIVDDVPSGNVSPAIDHEAFPVTAPDSQYWSQSPYGTNVEEHWTLNFEDGFTAHRTNDTQGIARCVR